jgi:hypothetical protein
VISGVEKSSLCHLIFAGDLSALSRPLININTICRSPDWISRTFFVTSPFPLEASMLGFGDLGVTLAFLATLGSALLCIGYGVLHWNDEGDGRGGRRQP